MIPGIDPEQFRLLVVRPALEDLGLWSKAAENLLMGTAMQESSLGHYLHQIGGGPAIGPFQMESSTHDDIWRNYLAYRYHYSLKLSQAYGTVDAQAMAYHLRYAAAMARIHYLRVPEALPAENNIEALAHYWKHHYNTHQGVGTVGQFINNYQRLLT